MKYILILLCMSMFPLFADTLGDVEYHLPAQIAKEWEIGNKLEYSKGATLIYIPKGTERQEAKEFFGVNINTLASNLDNIDSLKNGLAKMFPNMQFDLHVLEKLDNSVLYEWSAMEDGREKIHGWGRVFATKDGTGVLSYQTENISDLPKVCSLWLPVLKEAKLR